MARTKPQRPNNQTIDKWARNMHLWGTWVREDIAYIEDFLKAQYPGQFKPKGGPTLKRRVKKAARK